ncbi:hypothetical protein CK203_094239 [Vitis vinifera]|uniref:Reverse transcriptase Ty1/copia-type domain-containing protein n=1 Tax=Vitis vinifera TaxID=29760 RepID=A0A438DD53_VITVI|nr:hypothetical protein CK203_094239 [Vitis vinifera]
MSTTYCFVEFIVALKHDYHYIIAEQGTLLVSNLFGKYCFSSSYSHDSIPLNSWNSNVTLSNVYSIPITRIGIVHKEGDWDSLISPSSETPTLSPPSHSHPIHVTPPPSYLKDFYYYSTTSHSSSHSYPFFDVLGYAKLFSSHHALINVISSHVGPTFFSQAIVIPKWNQAMQAELQALEQNKTWYLTTFPPSTSCGLQVDVNNAFLHDDLAKGVNMCLPLGYHHEKEQLTSNISDNDPKTSPNIDKSTFKCTHCNKIGPTSLDIHNFKATTLEANVAENASALVAATDHGGHPNKTDDWL